MFVPIPRWLAYGIIALAAVLYVCYYHYVYNSPDTPRNKQARNMALAEAHIPAVAKVLQKDERFARVQLFAYTGDDGCLGVSGDVSTQAALDDLKRAILATDPPVPLHGMVKIFPEPED